MSEDRGAWHRPARASARWTVVLMGWVWLGHEGQRLDWPVASGLLAVASWWALRLFFSAMPRSHGLGSHASVAALGVTTAVGVLGVAQLGRSDATAFVLLGLSAVWACWSAAAESESTPQRCQRPWAGWPPVLAAIVTWAAIALPDIAGVRGLNAAGVLLLAVLLQTATPTAGVSHRHKPTGAAAVLPHTAMGLMMGSLWLGGSWCSSTGWPAHAVVGTHLLVMAGMPALLRDLGVPRATPPLAVQAAPLVLLVCGALALQTGNAPAHSWVGMGLITLAWALHSPRQALRTTPGEAAWRWAALMGPLLLLWVGTSIQTLGPQALTQSFGLLGAGAFLALLRLGWQAARTPTSTPSPL